MLRPVRRKIPHTVPQWVPEGSWFFITINCQPRGKNQLCLSDVGDRIIGDIAFNHLHLLWHCHLALLMPDHLHAILAFPGERDIAATIASFKRLVARKLNVKWQRDFFDHRLRNHHQLREKAAYIRANPVRKSLCERAEEWTWIYQPDNRPPPMRA